MKAAVATPRRAGRIRASRWLKIDVNHGVYHTFSANKPTSCPGRRRHASAAHCQIESAFNKMSWRRACLRYSSACQLHNKIICLLTYNVMSTGFCATSFIDLMKCNDGASGRLSMALSRRAGVPTNSAAIIF